VRKQKCTKILNENLKGRDSLENLGGIDRKVILEEPSYHRMGISGRYWGTVNMGCITGNFLICITKNA
jgi:hypothetical protein